MKYAGFWRRFAALFIDGLIVSAAPSIVFKHGYTNGINFLVAFGYSVWMLGTYGQTVGMMILKIKILKENGSKVKFADTALRYFAGILSGVVLLLGYLWMIWDKRRQTWHDHIAKTVIVKV